MQSCALLVGAYVVQRLPATFYNGPRAFSSLLLASLCLSGRAWVCEPLINQETVAMFAGGLGLLAMRTVRRTTEDVGMTVASAAAAVAGAVALGYGGAVIVTRPSELSACEIDYRFPSAATSTEHAALAVLAALAIGAYGLGLSALASEPIPTQEPLAVCQACCWQEADHTCLVRLGREHLNPNTASRSELGTAIC